LERMLFSEYKRFYILFQLCVQNIVPLITDDNAALLCV